MSDLITVDQLAERFGITVEQVEKYRLKKQWPCVKFGRNDVRFTAEQVEAIVSMHTWHVAPAAIKRPGIDGQTERSRRRAS